MDMQNKRVLFVTTKNLDYLRNTQEIEWLRESGAEVTVIGSPKKSYIKRLWHVYTRLLTVSASSFDMAFVGFAPQLVVPFFKRKLKKHPLYIDFFISMYDTLCLDRQKFKPQSLAGKLLKAIDKKTLETADHVITDTNAHGAFFAEELGADPQKLETLYLKADTSIYYPRAESLDRDPRFTVLYFGSVLPLQGVDVVLGAADRFKDRKDVRFIVVGPIKDTFEKPQGCAMEYYDWLSQADLADMIAQSDLCLAGHFHPTIGKAHRTIPGKAYIYQAMGKPMILGDNPANRELHNEQDKGIYFVPMGNADALADLIDTIRTEKENAQ